MLENAQHSEQKNLHQKDWYWAAQLKRPLFMECRENVYSKTAKNAWEYPP